MNAPSHSSYHALQVRLQQRFAHGFTLLGSYAYGKSIDNGSGVRTTDGDSLTPSDDYNLELERGLSAFDFRQRLTDFLAVRTSVRQRPAIHEHGWSCQRHSGRLASWEVF